MKLSGIRPSSQDNVSSKQPSLDNHESELRQQITSLREEKKSISNDKSKTSEEKKKEKQALQEEIQTLSSELRQYQIQKRQEEAARKREALKEASTDADEQEPVEEQDPRAAVFGSEASGVLISLSAAKGQISGMQRTQTDLERRQRTASTEEEKSSLQKKVNNVAKNIGKKITITEGSTAGSQDPKKRSGRASQVSDQPFDWKGQAEIVTAADDPEELYHGNLAVNRKKFFSTVSVFIR